MTHKWATQNLVLLIDCENPRQIQVVRKMDQTTAISEFHIKVLNPRADVVLLLAKAVDHLQEGVRIVDPSWDERHQGWKPGMFWFKDVHEQSHPGHDVLLRICWA